MEGSDKEVWYGNSTISQDRPTWHFSMLLAFLALILLIASLAANILIAVAILKYPKLRTNFNFYLLNIAGSEILFAFFAMSNFFSSMYYGYYPFGVHACTFWLYSDWTFSAATENTMMLVSLDRFVCVFYPVFYRNHQSNRYSLILIVLIWIWLHCLILPSLFLARWDASRSLEKGLCGIDHRKYLDLITLCVVAVFWVPEIVTVAAYCLIAVKMRRNRSAPPNTAIQMDSMKRVSRIFLRQSTLQADSANGTPSQENGSAESLGEKRTTKRRKTKDKKAFKLLTYLVFAVLFCCVPADVYHFVAALKPEWATYTFYQIASFLTFVHCFVTPILYHAGSTDMRTAVKTLIPSPLSLNRHRPLLPPSVYGDR